MFNSATGSPDSVGQLILMPLLFTFFALAARMSARIYWRNFGKRKNHYWYVYPLLVIALYFGFQRIYPLYNPDDFVRTAYAQTITTNKLYYGHYIAFLIPLVSLLGVIVYDLRERATVSRIQAQG